MDSVHPYWKPKNSTELEWCCEIAEWWKNQRKLQADMPSMDCRCHLLISKASLKLSPGVMVDLGRAKHSSSWTARTKEEPQGSRLRLMD